MYLYRKVNFSSTIYNRALILFVKIYLMNEHLLFKYFVCQLGYKINKCKNITRKINQINCIFSLIAYILMVRINSKSVLFPILLLIHFLRKIINIFIIFLFFPLFTILWLFIDIHSIWFVFFYMVPIIIFFHLEGIISLHVLYVYLNWN